MLQITIPGGEFFNEATGEFTYGKEQTLKLEHSLVSLSKWESKYHKPFLTKEEKTTEEMMYYIECMTLTQNVNPEVYTRLTAENFNQIDDYIGNPMTATRVYGDEKKGVNKEQITAELLYYWMIALQIPVEFQKWHLNRLIMLIRVCSVKNAPPKKRSAAEITKNYAQINEANRKRFNSKG